MELAGKKVLIVEDDILLSIVEERLIEKIGLEVVDKVTTGKKAIAAIKKNEPDVILMDIFLGDDMDGIETMKEIRKISNVPVIYLSGTKDAKWYKKAQEVGFAGFLVKPFQNSELKQCIEKAVA